MKYPGTLSLAVASIIFTACGPSAEEKAAVEQRKNDSIARVVEERTRLRVEMKLALEDSITQAYADKQMLETYLRETNANLLVEQDRMTRIKEWQFLRSPAEREEQIRQQSLVIDEVSTSIEELNEELMSCEKRIKRLEREVRKYE